MQLLPQIDILDTTGKFILPDETDEEGGNSPNIDNLELPGLADDREASMDS